jgi:hypothetical protein
MMGQEIYGATNSLQMQQHIERFVSENPVEFSPLLEPLKKADLIIRSSKKCCIVMRSSKTMASSPFSLKTTVMDQKSR